jgi:hypothetical protein
VHHEREEDDHEGLLHNTLEAARVGQRERSVTEEKFSANTGDNT